FHRAPAPALALDIDAVLGVLADHVAHHHVADSARRLAPHYDAARPAMHHDIRNRDVLGRPVHAQPVLILARLERNSVVAVIEVAVRDADVAARIDIDAARENAGE